MRVFTLSKSSDLRLTTEPLEYTDLPVPVPGNDEILLKVSACGVCHTELDEIEGRISPINYPVVPGHQAVGHVEKTGINAKKYKPGDRVGIAWINSACGECGFCRSGNDNLCDRFRATGKDADGGYAEYAKVKENYAFKIPNIFSDTEAAPLLCAGAIGYRSLRLANLKNGQNLGLTGFGGSAHLVLQTAKHQYPDSKIFVFARNETQRTFAMELGASWAGDTADASPEKLYAIIDTTPAWKPVIEALKNLERGGRLVINAIRKEEKDRQSLLELDYAEHLWHEKEIKSVANVAGIDVSEFLELAAEIPIRPEVQAYKFEEANKALTDLKTGNVRGAKVLVM